MKVAPLVILLLLLCVSTQAQTAYPDDGTVKNGVYANPFFGFGYRYPKDWVVSDEAINERIRERAKEEAAKTGISREMKDTYLLFTVARYPRGQQPSRVNPTIIIIAEKLEIPPPTAPSQALVQVHWKEVVISRSLQQLLPLATKSSPLEGCYERR